MKFIGIIPARYASSRFPGKPLALLGGKYVIQHVYETVRMALGEAYVATDDIRIYDAVIDFGGTAIMTQAEHKSGTDRIEEAAQKINSGADVIVNIQGDEPFIHPSQIEAVCKCFDKEQTQIATVGKKITNIEDISNPNIPKVIVDNNGYAMYFSRSPIPYIRGVENKFWLDFFPFLKHVGIYAFRRDVLRAVTSLPESSLEKVEKLEQLRWLQNGFKVKVGLTNVETIGIDTPQDLQQAERFIKQQLI